MNTQSNPLTKPLREFVTSAAAFFGLVVVGVIAVSRFRPQDGSLDFWLSVLPGIALSVWFYLLYRYLRHYDEMLRSLLLKALAAAAMVGLIMLFTAMIQVDFGMESLSHAFIIATMATAFIVCALYLKWRYR